MCVADHGGSCYTEMYLNIRKMKKYIEGIQRR